MPSSLAAGIDAIELDRVRKTYKRHPERFLTDPRPSSRVWVPFGAGTRHCIGNHLAMLTIKTVLRTVLGRTRLEAVASMRELGRPDKP